MQLLQSPAGELRPQQVPASCWKSTACSFQGGGRGARLPRAPRRIGFTGPQLPQPRPCGLPSQRAAGGVCVPLGGRMQTGNAGSKRSSGSGAGAAGALCSSVAARCPWLILHSGCLSLAASSSSQSCGEESKTWLRSPCSDLLQQGGPPPAHTTTPSQ